MTELADKLAAALAEKMADEAVAAVIESAPWIDPEGIELEQIDGGWHVKMAADGIHCIDVMRMMYGWRLMLADARPGRKRHQVVDKAWCYFGAGTDPVTGLPRNMGQAFVNAMLAAVAWDGVGEPLGFNKVAGA